jgi:hypothetical protein
MINNINFKLNENEKKTHLGMNSYNNNNNNKSFYSPQHYMVI